MVARLWPEQRPRRLHVAEANPNRLHESYVKPECSGLFALAVLAVMGCYGCDGSDGVPSAMIVMKGHYYSLARLQAGTLKCQMNRRFINEQGNRPQMSSLTSAKLAKSAHPLSAPIPVYPAHLVMFLGQISPLAYSLASPLPSKLSSDNAPLIHRE